MSGKDEPILNVSSILLSGNDYQLRSSQYINHKDKMLLLFLYVVIIIRHVAINILNPVYRNLRENYEFRLRLMRLASSLSEKWN
jgi:hypothetical protein